MIPSNEVKFMLILYASMTLMNVLIAVWFWIKSRAPIYSSLFRIWVASFWTLLLGGLAQEKPLVFLLAGIIPGCYSGSEGALQILFRFMNAEIKPNYKMLRAVIAACAVSCFLLRLAGLPFIIYSIPAAASISIPLVYGVFRLLREKEHPLTPAKTGFVLTCVLMGAHGLDLPFLGNRPDTVLVGLSIGVLITFCLAVFAPLVLIEIGAAETAQLEKDLELTLAVQSFLLPKKAEVHSPKINLVSHYKPAVKAGGDWWWVDETPEGHVHIIVGDVTGHGPDSAMVTALVASSYQTLMSLKPEARVGEILKALNNSMLLACEERYFMTMTVIDYDPKAGRYQWATAASPPFCHVGKDGKIKTVSGRSGLLGSKEFKFEEGVGSLQTGEKLLIFTDGVTDFETSTGKKLGLRRWVQMIEENQGKPIEQIRDTLVKKISEMSATTKQDDDMTFVVIEPPKAA